MIVDLIAVAAAAASATMYARSCIANRAADVSQRLEPISDASLATVLRNFKSRQYSNVNLMARSVKREDACFARAIRYALRDKALAAKQIRLLFNYTYRRETDFDLMHYFCWDEALREETEREVTDPPALVAISDDDFKTFSRELFDGTTELGNECSGMIDEWCSKYSFTLEQRCSVLCGLKNYTDKNGKYISLASTRRMVRDKMVIREKAKS